MAKFNNKAKGRNRKLRSGMFRQKTTKSLYRPRIPRTLQIATRRPTFTTLRFVKNLCYRVRPRLVVNGDSVAQNSYLVFYANSIVDFIAESGGQQLAQGTGAVPTPTFISQDPTEYGPPIMAADGTFPAEKVVHADGVSRFQPVYKHFTVMGSRCQASYEPIGTLAGDPATLYVNLNSGPSNEITTSSTMADINSLPYTKRAQILGSTTQGYGQGARLYQNYSAKKFEGVRHPSSATILRGEFPTDLSVPVYNGSGTSTATNGAQPNEKSFFTVGIMNTVEKPVRGEDPNVASSGILRVKLEYIVKLTEPTTLNSVSQPAADDFQIHFIQD